MKIKICGLSRPEDISVINEVLPDYAGFIINYPRSPRSVSPLRVRELTCRLDRRIQAVGVFVDSPPQLPVRMLREGVLAAVQLHGQESPDYIRSLKEQTGCPVIKAFPVKKAGDLKPALESPADYILLDHALGENGIVLDWELLAGINRPWFLAGGLGSDNLSEALEHLAPFAVDVNSSLETAGRKDPDKIRKMMAVFKDSIKNRFPSA